MVICQINFNQLFESTIKTRKLYETHITYAFAHQKWRTKVEQRKANNHGWSMVQYRGRFGTSSSEQLRAERKYPRIFSQQCPDEYENHIILAWFRTRRLCARCSEVENFDGRSRHRRHVVNRSSRHAWKRARE